MRGSQTITPTPYGPPTLGGRFTSTAFPLTKGKIQKGSANVDEKVNYYAN